MDVTALPLHFASYRHAIQTTLVRKHWLILHPTKCQTLREHYVRNRAKTLWRGPKYPNYNSSWLRCFNNWPHGKTPSPDVLSAAGFYYTGKDMLSLLFASVSLVLLNRSLTYSLRPYNCMGLNAFFPFWGRGRALGTNRRCVDGTLLLVSVLCLRYVKGDTYIRESRRLRSEQLYPTVEIDWINLIFAFFSLSHTNPSYIINSFLSTFTTSCKRNYK